MAPLPHLTLRDMTPNSQEYGADCDYPCNSYWR
jgi:hypothetical protein